MPKTDEIDLSEYWLLMKRRKSVICSSVLVSLALALGLNYLTKPAYRATAQILILQEPVRSPVTGEIVETRNPFSESLALDTTAALITNRTLMARVVAVLLQTSGMPRLEEPPSFLPSITSQAASVLESLLGQFLSPSPPPQSAEEEQAAALNEQIDFLLEMVSVKPVRNTRLINIHAENSDPLLARTIANTTAHLFIEYQVEQRAEESNNLAAYLESQLSQIRQKIKESELAFYSFKERESLFSLEGKLKENIETIGGLNASFIKTNTDRLAVEAKLEKLTTMRRENMPDGAQLPIQSEPLTALREKLVVAQAELAKAREVYKSQHPRLKALESVVEFIEKSIWKELDNNMAGLETERAILKSREEHLRSAIARGERELHEISKKTLQYSILEREFNTNRDLYNLLLTKLKETDITGKVRRPLIGLVEPAAIPPDPIRPMKALNLILGVLGGLMGGIGLAFLKEYLWRTIRTPRDVAERLQLPVLGMIPKEP